MSNLESARDAMEEKNTYPEDVLRLESIKDTCQGCHIFRELDALSRYGHKEICSECAEKKQ